MQTNDQLILVDLFGRETGHADKAQAHRTPLLLVLTAAAFAGSLFGFGDLIGTVYPVYGYLGMAAMLLVAEHAVHARRAGHISGATSD